MSVPDDSRDEPGRGTPEGPRTPGDFDAAFRAIVEHYGERASLSSPPDVEPSGDGDHGSGPASGPADTTPAADPHADPPIDPALFSRRHLDPDPQPRREPAEEHFVPPDPPLPPRGTPARRLAWLGLFAPPVLMLLAVVLGWSYPEWLAVLLVAGFVGGFVFLVATMPRERPGDGGDGDDGAVV